LCIRRNALIVYFSFSLVFISTEEYTQDENFSGRLTPLKGALPSEIGHLSALETFIVSGMEVEGPILDYLHTAANLTYLEVNSNNFTGTIPDTFSTDHSKLTYLNLEGNAFNGEIPKTLGELKILTTLNLNHNHFKGTIPSELAGIPTLRT
jgi:Leucine-rich repeat (LRR) protein